MAANGGSLSATHTALLPTRALSKGARESYVVPGVQELLVSVPVLSSNGYTTVFLPGIGGVKIYEKGGVNIVAKSPPVIQGWRDGRGLFMVPIADEATISQSIDIHESANSIYESPSTKEVVRFLHAALGFPTKATLLTAARHGNLATLPGLTPENISRHFPESEETQKRHMKQKKQGVRSTKVVDEDAMLSFQPVKHKDVYLRVYDATKKAMYSDQTGNFPITLSQGNKYIMVAVELDGNFIDAEPIQSRKAKALTKAYQNIFNRWKATGAVSPNRHILDNEAPKELKEAIRENKCNK
jgi:hypothetical protein